MPKLVSAEMATPPDTVGPQDLIGAARSVYDNAYAPYSEYRVAAEVRAEDGTIYTGCNVENAVYPLTICAERAAIFNAISDGARKIVALAVVTANRGSPCGACRQVMREFGADEMPIYVADVTGAFRTHTLGELLPESFSGDDLRVAWAE
ncbi:MAG: cytidine deaminase [Anaerolineae bacterium]|nr:cytidine deaminase [Anaerolineae bacterium]